MLTIQNYYRLCEKKIPLTNWQVDYCAERNDYYEIKLINKNNGNDRKFQLSRKSEYSQTGKWAYYFSENGNKLPSAITTDYMKDMNSFLSGLGTILQYG
jgi:hypothetical protein